MMDEHDTSKYSDYMYRLARALGIPCQVINDVIDELASKPIEEIAASFNTKIEELKAVDLDVFVQNTETQLGQLLQHEQLINDHKFIQTRFKKFKEDNKALLALAKTLMVHPNTDARLKANSIEIVNQMTLMINKINENKEAMEKYNQEYEIWRTGIASDNYRWLREL